MCIRLDDVVFQDCHDCGTVIVRITGIVINVVKLVVRSGLATQALCVAQCRTDTVLIVTIFARVCRRIFIEEFQFEVSIEVADVRRVARSCRRRPESGNQQASLTTEPSDNAG